MGDQDTDMLSRDEEVSVKVLRVHSHEEPVSRSVPSDDDPRNMSRGLVSRAQVVVDHPLLMVMSEPKLSTTDDLDVNKRPRSDIFTVILNEFSLQI